MMTKLFSFMHIRKVHFKEWDAHSKQGVTQCDTGMSKSRRINDNTVDFFQLSGMDTLNQLMLCIALQVSQLVTSSLRLLHQPLIDLLKGHRTVYVWLTGTQ